MTWNYHIRSIVIFFIVRQLFWFSLLHFYVFYYYFLISFIYLFMLLFFFFFFLFLCILTLLQNITSNTKTNQSTNLFQPINYHHTTQRFNQSTTFDKNHVNFENFPRTNYKPKKNVKKFWLLIKTMFCWNSSSSSNKIINNQPPNCFLPLCSVGTSPRLTKL